MAISLNTIKEIIDYLENEKKGLEKEASSLVEIGEDNLGLLEKMASLDLVISELKKWQ